MKIANECDHLIVAGNFNLNMDELLMPSKIKAKKPTAGQLLLKEREEELIYLLEDLKLLNVTIIVVVKNEPKKIISSVMKQFTVTSM